MKLCPMPKCAHATLRDPQPSLVHPKALVRLGASDYVKGYQVTSRAVAQVLRNVIT